MAVALNLQHRGGRLPRCHGDFQRLASLVGHRSRGLGLRSRREVNEQLRFVPKGDFAKVVHFFGCNVAGERRRGDDFRGGGVAFIRLGGVQRGVDRSLGFGVAGLNHQRR